MDELLTRKAIAEILHGMQSESNKSFEERKVNPLGKPNKNFLGRTIHSMMNHNKRELQKTRKNCQEKLKELNDYCNNRDELDRKTVSGKGLKRKEKNSSDIERSHSYRHTKKMKKKRKKTKKSESSDSSNEYSDSKKKHTEQFEVDDEEYEEDASTYNMDAYNGYAIIPITHYPMLPYFTNQHNEAPKTEDDIDKEIMRDLRSSSSDQNSDSNNNEDDDNNSSSDGEILTIHVSSSSSSSSSLASDSDNSELNKTLVISCNSSSSESDSVILPHKIRRKNRNGRIRRRNESIQSNINNNTKNVESDIIELISDNSCEVDKLSSTDCSPAVVELPSTDATINTNLNVPAGNTSDFVDLTED